MSLGIDWASIINATTTVTKDVYFLIHDYVDVHYMQWLAWVLYPLVLSILAPFIFALFVFACALFLYLYKLRHYLRDAITDAVNRGDFWDGARYIIASLWEAQGKIWHGMHRYLEL